MNLPITAIIVNYNAGYGLLDCVASIIDDIGEILVVDNASNDESIVMLQATYAHKSHLRIILNKSNLGFAAACNIGATAAKNTYWLFLNPDCICKPNSIATLYTILINSPKAGMAGGLILNTDGSEQAGGRRLTPTPMRTLVRAFGLQRFAKRWPKLLVDFNLHHHPLPSEPINVEAISGAYMMVKPEAVKSVGLWDEGYFLHCEDLDWCMRFVQAGWDILFIPSSPISHAQGACSKSRPIFVEWHKHKGMTRFYLKFFRNSYSLPLLWVVIITIWVRFALLTLKKTINNIITKRKLF